MKNAAILAADIAMDKYTIEKALAKLTISTNLLSCRMLQQI